MQDDRPPRRGKGRRRREDRGRDGMPGLDSGFFTRDGFEAELDAGSYYDNSAENTALNDMDPIREAQLFEQFEQDYRSGGYDPGPDFGNEQPGERFGPDPRDISGYRPLATPTDSGYHAAPDDSGSGYRSAPGDRPRHGKNRDRRAASEGGPRIPMFARKHKPVPRSAGRSAARSAQPNQPSPFGELTPYLLPILAAVVIVMVIVVLLLNR